MGGAETAGAGDTACYVERGPLASTSRHTQVRGSGCLNGDMLSTIDLFAGCGGFGLGLEQAGFSPVYFNELNADARGTYITNRVNRHEWFQQELNRSNWTNRFCSGDARALVSGPSPLRNLQRLLKTEFAIGRDEVDVVVGGPPCQGFSGIGHRRSYAVAKSELPSNHLYSVMAAIVGAIRPRAFVFENVRGLLHSRWASDGVHGEIWSHVKRAFISLGGYTIATQLLFAKDYGVPQNRPRIILIGYREGIVDRATTLGEINDIDDTAILRRMLPPANRKKPPDLVDLLGDLVQRPHTNGGVTPAYPQNASNRIQRTMRLSPDGKHVYNCGDFLREQAYSKHSPVVVRRFQAMLRGKSHTSTRKFSQRVLPARWGADGPSITATSLPDDYVHFEQPRSLTVREWARLQGFPDWYEFVGKRTTGGLRRAGNPQLGLFDRELPKYTQIGNAVPVELARAIGNHIASTLRRE